MLVYIKPLSVFPELHSDTVFGALMYSISQLYPEKVEEMIEEFKNNPPFLLSSPFPYTFNEGKIVRFYPKILLKQKLLDEELFDNVKKYKKIKYIEENIFYMIIRGEISEEDIIKNLDDYAHDNGFLRSKDYKISFSRTVIPNNSINRITNMSDEIFYTSGMEFKKNMGLYFYVKFNDESYIPIVKSSLKFLKDRGFGGNISVGKGQFDYEITDEDVKTLDGDAKFFINLSRFIPSDSDLEKIGNSSLYEIASKRGRSSSGEIKKQIRFFKEGSIFPVYADTYGCIVDVGSDNSPSIEYGFAFPLNTKIDLGGV